MSEAAKLASLEKAHRSGPFSILLVDDHHDTSVALEKLLTRRGHVVAAAHDMRSAVEAAAAQFVRSPYQRCWVARWHGLELMTDPARQSRAFAESPSAALE